jgi:wyosine [tRNA(Phe)-imidazoG37] synthetase (radical SAM superfamily)
VIMERTMKSSYTDGTGPNGLIDAAVRERRAAGEVITKGSHPNSIANLKTFTSENARANQAKGVKMRILNQSIQEEFKLNARNFQKIMSELPQLSSLDVLRMAVHTAIAKDNWEDAARYAGLLAEFEAPKLQRIESSVTTRTSEMTDEELKLMIASEGLLSLGTD